MKLKPKIRELKNGDVVVDFERKWFRCKLNGEVICSEIYTDIEDGFGKVRRRRATSKERLLALGHAALSE